MAGMAVTLRGACERWRLSHAAIRTAGRMAPADARLRHGRLPQLPELADGREVRTDPADHPLDRSSGRPHRSSFPVFAMVPVASSLAPGGVSRRHAIGMIRALPGGPQPQPEPPCDNGIGVLRYRSASRTAGELQVSHNTLRAHVRNHNAKLGTHRCTACWRRSRRSGLSCWKCAASHRCDAPVPGCRPSHPQLSPKVVAPARPACTGRPPGSVA